MRRGGRSSIGRGSVWPAALLAMQMGSMVTGVAAVAIWGITGSRVGLVALAGCVLVWAGAEVYHRHRWLPLQEEIFRKRESLRKRGRRE
jgi:hypothetical protein